MNQSERNETIKALAVMADVYGRPISKAAISFMADALMDLDGQKVLRALCDYAKDPASRGFPLPGQVRAMVSPEVSKDQLATEAANKIVEAMGKFGWTNPDKARAFMGELAWEVVVREGGWSNLCERTTNDDLPIMRAQWRELAKVVHVRQQQAKASLPSPELAMLDGKRSDKTIKRLQDQVAMEKK
jgi:hypothetical protein